MTPMKKSVSPKLQVLFLCQMVLLIIKQRLTEKQQSFSKNSFLHFIHLCALSSPIKSCHLVYLMCLTRENCYRADTAGLGLGFDFGFDFAVIIKAVFVQTLRVLALGDLSPSSKTSRAIFFIRPRIDRRP
jgi:hypothetical protein